MANLRDLTSRMIIGNVTVPFFLVMKPNPQVFRVSNEKVFSMSQTLGAWITEHWGNRPEELEVAGWTGRKIGNDLDKAKVEFYKLRLEQLYKLDKERMTSLLKTMSVPGANVSDLAGKSQDAVTGRKPQSLKTLAQSFILYRYTLYFGFFTNMTISEETQYIRLYTYRFNFMVTMNTTDYLVRSMVMNGLGRAALGLSSGVDLLK